jgi:hypothetical protein
MKHIALATAFVCSVALGACSDGDETADCTSSSSDPSCVTTTRTTEEIDPALRLKVGDELIDPCTLISNARVAEVTTKEVAIVGWRSVPGARGCTIRTGTPELEINFVVSNPDVIARDSLDELVGLDTPQTPQAYFDDAAPIDGSEVGGLGTSAVEAGRADPTLSGLVHELRIADGDVAVQVTLIGDDRSYTSDELGVWARTFGADLLAATSS